MVSKTRDKLIEVARQLFAYKGVENTTMNDIAEASDKGRRTIYTYFKNKKEIYNAVLERQSNAVIEKLKNVVDNDLPVEDKLREYLHKRIEITSDWPQPKHDRYRALFSRDVRRMEKVNKLAIAKERALFASLLRQGVESGEFDPAQARRVSLTLSLTLASIDNCQINNTFDYYGADITEMTDSVIEFVIEGLKAHPAKNTESKHQEK